MAIFRPYSSSDALRSDRSAGDRQRHREKLREAIRDNIADIISEESIIGRDRDRIIKVPIRGIKEYRFVYGDNQAQVGSGDGETEPGQVVGKAPKDGERRGARRRSAGRRLLRDRRHARRADRDHVRGSRVARHGAQDPARGDVRPHRQAQGLPPRRRAGPSRSPAHRQGAHPPAQSDHAGHGRRAAAADARRCRTRKTSASRSGARI